MPWNGWETGREDKKIMNLYLRATSNPAIKSGHCTKEYAPACVSGQHNHPSHVPLQNGKDLSMGFLGSNSELYKDSLHSTRLCSIKSTVGSVVDADSILCFVYSREPQRKRRHKKVSV